MPPSPEPAVTFKFPTVERLGGTVLSLDRVEFRWSGGPGIHCSTELCLNMESRVGYTQ